MTTPNPPNRIHDHLLIDHVAQQLDGRTAAAKLFDRLVADVLVDLGGGDNVSTIERRLVEAFVGSSVLNDQMNLRVLLGEPVNLSEYAQTVSAMVRVASRLGLQRRAKDITGGLSLGDVLAAGIRQQHADTPD
jgi:hypothetical protein